ncbi:DUF418 domain-containing protein [Xanthomarina spongicola]|uniref:DUF418 domain-containing protein n=1 Tax=Xanthomarina spongicola TaxID=570520 RepID=A0A316E4E0_9FLAO|nr:DUF418 domain-containing protein [Xanthomarina spongicola]PWK17760.1 uncharacterized protein LX78_02551 [Xanthomarina spongicola]
MTTNKTTNTTLQPVTKEERIDFLDILRGIAIFFIFAANIIYFSGFFFFPPEAHIPSTNLVIDPYVDFISFTLIDGKFYSIFSLLFGIGCAIQFNKLNNLNKPFAPFFRRRMFWLLIIGLIHLCLFWLGDILTLYALLGFVLICFVKMPNKKLITWSIILILFPLANWFIIHIANFNYPMYLFHLNTKYAESMGFQMVEWQGVKRFSMQAHLLNQDILEFFKMNVGNTLIRIGNILREGRIFKVLGIFLIGLWAGRKIINEDLLNNTKFLKRVALWGVCIGLPISVFRTYIEFFSSQELIWDFLNTLSYAFGTVPLAMGYAALLALFYRKGFKFLHWFAPVGKTALSNYIFQTFIAITIFYGIGFGWAGKFGITVIMGITLTIFAFQIIMSIWWLKHFRFGPLEWIWRQLTYNKRIKLKK